MLHCLTSRLFKVSEGVYKEYYDLHWKVMTAVGLLYSLVPQRDVRGAVESYLRRKLQTLGTAFDFRLSKQN